MTPSVVQISPNAVDDDVLARAAAVIRAGGLLLYPTDTLYGLGADALNAEAVRRVCEVKGRPAHQALPVIVGDLGQLTLLSPPLPEELRSMLRRLWPAPLTVVLPARAGLSARLTGDGDSVAVRWPRSAFAQALCRLSDTPIIATSANRSGAGNPTSFAESLAQLGDAVDLAIDAGPPADQRGSSIIDLRSAPARLLRRGAVAQSELAALLGELVDATSGE